MGRVVLLNLVQELLSLLLGVAWSLAVVTSDRAGLFRVRVKSLWNSRFAVSRASHTCFEIARLRCHE